MYDQYPSLSILSQMNNMSPVQYAQGGYVNPIQKMIETVRRQGEDEDQILAYINPEEAAELDEMQGHDINPKTGLPQYGFLKKALKKVRKIAPIAGAVAGNYIAPGLGGIIGGGLGGALGGKKPLKNIAMGAGLGALQGYGLPFLGRTLGGMGSSGLGNMLESAGSSNFMPLFQSLGGNEPSFEGEPQGGGMLGGGLNPILLALTVAGALGRKEKYKIPGAYKNEPSLHEIISSIRKEKNPEDAARPISPYEHDPELFEVQDVLDKDYIYPRFAKGGLVEGVRGGQDDDIPRKLKEGSYIIDATTVSLLGDGNTQAGRRELDRLFNRFSHLTQKYAKGDKVKDIDALISSGEYEVKRPLVTALGNGNNDLGAKKIKKMIANIRRHKRVRGLPPKSRPLDNYLTMR